VELPCVKMDDKASEMSEVQPSSYMVATPANVISIRWLNETNPLRLP
jgi:hypothetical protein